MEDKKKNKKMKKILKTIFIISISVIIIELIIMLVMKILNERKMDRVDTLNDIITVDDGYIAVGTSDFHNSDFVKEKKYDYVSSISNKKRRIVASQARLVKMDKNKNIIWESTFPGEYDSSFYSVLKVDDGYMAVGSYISKEKQIDAETRDGIIVKYDLDGKYLWHKDYSVLSDTEFYKIIKDNENFIVVGQSIYENMELGNHYTGGGIIVKYDKDGNVLANNNYGGNKSGLFNDVIKVSDGYIACGRDGSNYGILVKFPNDFQRDENDHELISKKVSWQRTYSNTNTNGFTKMLLLNDTIYLSGSINISDQKDDKGNIIFKYDAGIVTYNVKGKYLGKYSFGGDKDDCYTSITSDGVYLYLTGITNSSDLDIDNFSNNDKTNSFIAKYNLKGELLNKVAFIGNENDLFNNLKITDDKLLIIGTSNSTCDLYGCDYHSFTKTYDKELKAE